MIPRRHLVTGGVLGGVLGALTQPDEAVARPGIAEQQEVSARAIERIADAIDGLKKEVHAQTAFEEISTVREAQKLYLRGNGKFPDYVEVGTDVWLAVHDWHVRWQQPITLGRDQLGRYTIVLHQTVVIMRVDAAPGFVGTPYDNR